MLITTTGYKLKLVDSCSSYDAKNGFCDYIDDLKGWGYEPESNWATLYTKTGAEKIPSEQGRYHDYYEAFADAVKDSTPPPVTAEMGTAVLAFLDAARQSVEEQRSVAVQK